MRMEYNQDMKAYVESSYEVGLPIYFNIAGRGQDDIVNKVQRFVDRQPSENQEYTIHWNKSSKILASFLVAKRDGSFSGAVSRQKTVKAEDFISH